MSLKFINKKAKGYVSDNFGTNVLYYTFKHMYIAISGFRSNSIISFMSNKNIYLYQINIEEERVNAFWEEYKITGKISIKFEKELQKILDDNFEILLNKLNECYFVPVKQCENSLNEAKLEYNKFRKCYEKELILI
jgi:hypothetical protein